METTKPIWQSRSVIGSVIAIIAMLAGLRGVVLGEAVQAELTDFVMQIIGLIGAGVAIWGRIVASQKLVK